MTDNRPGDGNQPDPALFATIHNKSEQRPDGYTAEDIAELNLLANKASRPSKRRKVLLLASGAVALVVLIAGGAAWLSPTWTPGQIMKAAKAGDRTRLERLVDFEAVRSSFEADLKDTMRTAFRKEIAPTNDPFALLFSGLGNGIIDSLATSIAEQLVTPRTLERAANGEEIEFALMGVPQDAPFDSKAGHPPSFDVTGKYLTTSRYEYQLRSKSSDANIYVQMQRSGPFAWRVDRVRLDPSWMDQLTNDVDKAPVNPEPLSEASPVLSVRDETQPSFPPGKLYQDFRAELLQSGYSPIPQARSTSESYCGTEYLDEGEPDLCAAYPEVETCAGTGTRPCIFLFRRTTDGRTLGVSTEGELFERITVTSTEWRD